MTDIFQQEQDKFRVENKTPTNGDIFGRTVENPALKQIQSNVESARDFNPDMEAKAINLSTGLNVPWNLVRGNEAKFEKARTGPDPRKLVSNFPRTADYYKDFDATLVSIDDSKELENVESVWDKLRKIPEKAATSFNIGQQNVEGGKLYSEKIFDILSGADSPELAARIAEFEAKRIEDTEDTNILETGVTAAAEMLPLIGDVILGGQAEGLAYASIFGTGALVAGQLGPQVAVPEEAITVPAASLIGYTAGVRIGASKQMFMLEGGSALQEMLQVTNENGEKIDPQVAAVASIGVGAVNAGLEYFGLKSLSKLVPGGDKLIGRFTTEAVKEVIKKQSVQEALKAVLKQYGKTVTAETATEIGQEVVTILGTEIAKQMSEGEFEQVGFYEEVLPRLAETAKEAAAATATLGLPIASVKAGMDVQRAKNQQSFSEKFEQIQNAVEATKTKERSPLMTEKHLNNLGLGDAYISAEGINELFQTSPETAAQVLTKAGIDPVEARKDAASGNDVKTSLSKIHSYLTPEEQNLLQPNIKPAPSAMTEREVEAIDIQQEIDRTSEQVKEYTEKQRSLQQTKSDLRKQIIDSGFKPQYADDVITLTESFANRMGLDGLDKEQFLKKISVQANIEQAGLGQSVFKSSKDIDQKWKEKGVEVFTFEKGDKIFLETLIVPKDIRKQGTGTDVLNDLIEYADSTGKRIELTPAVKDDYQGTTSRSRLIKFYKRFGFVENKGRNKDFTTSKSMYREPKVTFDQADTITKKIKEFFAGKETKRGSVNITDDKYIISLFENKNYSTLVHELGHVFLNEYSILAEQSETLKPEFDKLRDWLEVEPGKDFERKHHEKFAKAFETYLAEGKAPTRELKAVFRRFKNWLLTVYQKAVNTGVRLDPEIRGIFDRMFTTRMDAFNSAKANNMEMWTKEEMDALAVLPDDRKYMSDLYKASIEKADEEVTWRRNKARVENEKKWKEQAQQEVNSMPEYVAIDTIKRQGGLNAFAVRDMFGDTYLEYIKTRLGKDFINEGGGVDPVEIAALSGFQSANEMVRKIATAESKEIAYQTALAKKQATSDANYQVEDYLTDSKEWEEFLRLKSSYLLKAGGKPSQVAPTKAFRQFAKEQLDEENVRDAIANKRYLANASKYSRIERDKMRAKKIDEAAQASQIARLNFVKADIATNNKAFYGKAVRGIKKLLKSKSITTDTQYQINDLAARFGLLSLRPGEKIEDALERTRKGVPDEDNVPIYDWAQGKIDAGYDVQFPAFVLDGTVKDYRELTWSQFEDLKESFDQIKTVDRQERYYTAFEQAKTMDEVRIDLVDQLLVSHKERDISRRDEGPIEKFFKGTDAWTTKIETVLRMIDGGEINGTWWNYYLKPIQVAETAEADRLRIVRKDLRELFKKTDIKDSMFRKFFTDGMPRPLTKSQLLSVALNWGNEDNRTKLKDGWGWSDAQVAAILDNLTKEDWDFVQGTWDYIDSFRPESFAVAKEMTGKRPDRVEPSEVQTKYGTYKGGYYPLAYDPRKSLRTAMHMETKDLKSMFQKSHAAPNTKPGSHIQRQVLAGGQKPILDLGVIPDHIFDVVHDITHRNAVINVAKLARDKEVQDTLVKTIGIDLAKQFKDWLVDISNDQNKPSSPLHKFAAWARRGTTVVNMGLKMTTMVQQFVGATQSIDEIGPVAFAKGMNLFFGSGGLAGIGERGDYIREKSGFMRNRLLSFDRDIRDATKAITPMKKLRADAMKGMFLGIGLAQWYGVDAPTWMGAYDKYLRENQGQKLNDLDANAVDYADSVVRQTQGGGSTKDLSKIQRGDELMRMFTMFYSYFNVLYNLGKLRISQTVKGQRPPVYALASMALLWFIPATLSEVVSARGPKDDEEWAEWALPLVAMYPFQTVVGVRDISNAIGSGFGYQLTPAESAVKNLIWLTKDTWDAVAEGETEGLAEKAFETSGYLAPIPSKQLSTWLFNAYDLLTGEDDELNYSDLLRRNRK
jgi:hypothetical protein